MSFGAYSHENAPKKGHTKRRLMDCLSCPTLLIEKEEDIGGAREGKSMRESSAGFKLLLMEETFEPKLRLLSGGGNSLLDFFNQSL